MKHERPKYVYDDRGVKWFIAPGDPANKVMLALKAKGYTDQTLTRNVLRGRLEEQTVPLPSAANPRSVRLWECMEASSGA